MHSEHCLHTVQCVCHAERMAPQGQRLHDLHRIDTRRRLGEAAMELAEELGADQVKAEDIAKRVGISRRTLFNYVPSVNAALNIPIEDFLEAVRQNFLDRLAIENPFKAAASAISAADPALIPPLARVCGIGVEATGAYRFAAWTMHETSLREDIARHLDPATDPLYIRILAASIMEAGRVAATMWAAEDPSGQHPERFVELHLRTLDYLGSWSTAPDAARTG